MKSTISRILVLALLAIACSLVNSTNASASQSVPQKDSPMIVITRSDAVPSAKGTPDRFVGAVKMDTLAEPKDASLARVISVSFAPGAHTNWHSHPLGQILVVTAGMGYIQQWGGKVEQIHPGDVIWTPPNVKHWHGAGLKESMTHISIYDEPKGQVTNWMEPVTAEQYSAAH